MQTTEEFADLMRRIHAAAVSMEEAGRRLRESVRASGIGADEALKRWRERLTP